MLFRVGARFIGKLSGRGVTSNHKLAVFGSRHGRRQQGSAPAQLEMHGKQAPEA